jgi:hypothetical protein
LQGAELGEIFERFVDAEFRSDWDAARSIHGDEVTPSLLARTSAQRRADALSAIFRRAASTAPDAQSPEPTVNILIDKETFEEELRRLAGETVPALDPIDATTRTWRTHAGDPLSPRDAVAAAIRGHVRRVVIGADSVVIDLSRRARLFRGGAKDAVLLTELHCTWTGCPTPSRRCEGGHTLAFRDRGVTAPHNGGPECRYHNNLKNRGYRTWRDPGGVWHTFRPDGSEIT